MTPDRPLVGSLFSGYLGLDAAVLGVFGGDLAWVCDNDPGVCLILGHRVPGVPNLGDVTAVDWATVPRVDILTVGFPCFAAGTMVLTLRGYVPIETVTTSDQVLTHTGRWRKVTSTMSRDNAPLWQVKVDWGPYAPAIARWEAILGRPAPSPTEAGVNGQPRLSPALPEWMMGLPEGWVTGVPGLSRTAQLRALGNGVVPMQAAAALRRLRGVWLDHHQGGGRAWTEPSSLTAGTGTDRR